MIATQPLPSSGKKPSVVPNGALLSQAPPLSHEYWKVRRQRLCLSVHGAREGHVHRPGSSTYHCAKRPVNVSSGFALPWQTGSPRCSSSIPCPCPKPQPRTVHRPGCDTRIGHHQIAGGAAKPALYAGTYFELARPRAIATCCERILWNAQRGKRLFSGIDRELRMRAGRKITPNATGSGQEQTQAPACTARPRRDCRWWGFSRYCNCDRSRRRLAYCRRHIARAVDLRPSPQCAKHWKRARRCGRLVRYVFYRAAQAVHWCRSASSRQTGSYCRRHTARRHAPGWSR